jgi:dTDP-glucose pyrophosphorylase
MITSVIENLQYPEAHYILIGKREHLDGEADLVKQISSSYNASFISIDTLTEGTACTVLFARRTINTDVPLLIANSDQLIDIAVNDFVDDCLNKNLDGSILTFTDRERNPKWSFARLNNKGLVVEVQEKKAISELATVGIYFFTQGSDFVNGAIDMIIHNDRVNNEFYTCPVYNYLIKEGKKIGIYTIAVEQMHGLGTPEDLEKYLHQL